MAPNRKISSLLLAVDVVGLVLTLVLVACLYLFSLGPNIGKQGDLEEEMRDLLQRLSDQPRLVVAIADAERMKADMLDWAAPPREILPANLDFENVYATMTEGADKNRVLVKYVKPDKITRNKTWGYRELRVSIRATASFEDFHHFLQYLATRPDTLIRLQTLTVRPIMWVSIRN